MFSFLILTQRSKAECQSKHKSKHKNNIQLIDCLADSHQFSLKHLSVFTQSADLRLRLRAKRVVDLAEPISKMSEQSQRQHQIKVKDNIKSTCMTSSFASN